jgi:uncharacterized protein (DUF697 family)
MSTPEQVEQQGRRLLSAVERLVDDCDDLIAQVAACRAVTYPQASDTEPGHLIAAASRLISTYSTKSAFAGALTALPGMMVGPGTVVAMVGGSLADMTLMLKYEVELALCLTHLYGHDIRDERERWLAYLLATVTTYEAGSGHNYFVDLAVVQLEALRKYTPRQLSKMAVTAMGRYALQRATRGVFKAVPLVGIVIGASANKLLTTSVGWRCVDALSRRQQAPGPEQHDIVEAKVT